MDLGIEGRKAIVCASSQGLGFACALALAREGVEVILNGRRKDKLTEARTMLLRSWPAGKVRVVAADITTEDGRSALLDACADADILVNNNAGPPPGKLADWDRNAWIAALDANMLPAILLIREVLPGMRARQFGRIVNITSAMVKSPHPLMGLSTAARAGLTAVCKALSHEAAPDNVTINNLLPERIDTPRQEFMAQRLMQEQSVTYETARRQIVQSVSAKRFGTPEEFGDACAYLCSRQAGFISGQNLQLDGGSYAGLI
jgi:3-oxoacyl-[acyl-carrier protein] reductase